MEWILEGRFELPQAGSIKTIVNLSGAIEHINVYVFKEIHSGEMKFFGGSAIAVRGTEGILKELNGE